MSDQERVSKIKWFHAIDFGEYASSGRFPKNHPQNVTLYGAFEFLKSLDLTDADCLDIGAADGIISFGMAGLGAKRVCAVDSFNTEGFVLSREILGLEEKIEYFPGVQVSALHEHFRPKSFDCIVCAGVIYHMLYPAQAFAEPRKLLKDGGILILETPFIDDEEEPIFMLNSQAAVNEPRSYFVPTRNALKDLGNMCGFRVLAERVLEGPRRITLLLQAATREELIEDEHTPPFVVQMLKRDLCDDVLRHEELEKLQSVPTSIKITNVEPARTIIANQEEVDFPYHPDRYATAFGETRFEQADGNTKVL